MVYLLSLLFTSAGAKDAARQIPHGLMPGPLSGKARAVHERVVAAVGGDLDVASEACQDRLEELHRLIDDDKLQDMIDLSMALPADMREALPTACSADEHHVRRVDQPLLKRRVSAGRSRRSLYGYHDSS